MDAPDATVANNSLWSAYLRQQWWWIEPVSAFNLSSGVGASIAAAYAFWFESLIGRLYADNAPAVTNFVDRLAEVKREAQQRGLSGRHAEWDAVPEWLSAAHDAPIEDTQATVVLA
jgi:hypothetical protein